MGQVPEVTPTEVAVVRAMAAVSETFVRIADVLRQRSDVRRVSRPWWLRAEDRVGEDHFRVGSGEGFRAEWYAEAEFVHERILTFAIEVAWHDGEWVVDASVKSMIDGDEMAVLELPRRFAIDGDEVTTELMGQAKALEGRFDEALRRFGTLS